MDDQLEKAQRRAETFSSDLEVIRVYQHFFHSGVYLVKRRNQEAVLKIGSQARTERESLEHLVGIRGVPKLIEYYSLEDGFYDSAVLKEYMPGEEIGNTNFHVSELIKIRQMVDDSIKEFLARNYCLRDIHNSNIVVDQNLNVGFIDFGFGKFSERVLSRDYARFVADSKEFVDGMFEFLLELASLKESFQKEDEVVAKNSEEC